MKPLEFQNNSPSETDFLTGCLLKKDLVPCLEKLEEKYHQQKEIFSILFVDVDNFRKLNSKYGHLEGDEVLRYFAITMHLVFKNVPSLIFRYGGDEFVLAFPAKSDSEVMELARSWINKLKANEFKLKSINKLVNISFSAGIASYPVDSSTIKGLIHQADKAMYFAKKHKRGTVILVASTRRTRVIKIFILLICLVPALFFLCSRLNSSKLINYCTSQGKQLLQIVKEKISGISLGGAGQLSQGASPGGMMHKLQEIKEDISSGNLKKPAVSAADKPSVLDTVYLTSGEVVRGEVVYEDETVVRIKFKPESGGSGYAIIAEPKSQVSRIEKANTQNSP